MPKNKSKKPKNKYQGKRADAEIPHPNEPQIETSKTHLFDKSIKAAAKIKNAAKLPPAAPKSVEITESKQQEVFEYSNILTLQEVARKIKVKDLDTVKKWLFNKKITAHKAGKQVFIYYNDFRCAMAKPYALELKRKFPRDWLEIYSKIEIIPSVYHLVVREILGETRPFPTTTVIAKTEEDKKLLRELRSDIHGKGQNE